ncbi:ComF family protein [Patescibacteria group bacterium]|nr:ComF family protein [Patescibacteria group bacterium]
MKNIWSTLIDIIFPINCLGCGKETHWLCQKCLKSIPLNQSCFCPICQKKQSTWGLCPNCQKDRQLDGVIITADYHNKLLQKLIFAYKYQFAFPLASPLSQLIINYFAYNNLDPDFILTSLPLHQKRYKLRCFNQAELVTNYLADQFNLTFDPDLISRVKNTKPQARLNKKQRAINIQNAFTLNRGCYGRKILIVDDVFTTGSTLNECAKLLKVAGAKEVWGLVIAQG